MYVVGLTGGIATGKSTVLAQLRAHGLPVIDSDLIARQVVQPGQPAWHAIRRAFGAGLFDDETGELRREALGQLVFADRDNLRRLNAITHPRIRAAIVRRVLGHLVRGERFVVVDCPLLFETGAHRFVQRVVVVECSERAQKRRLLARNAHLTDEEADQRIAAQISLQIKCSKANYILHNDKDVASLKLQVDDLVSSLRASHLYLPVRLLLLSLAALIVYAFFYFVPVFNRTAANDQFDW